jgi:hypothetical protein
VHIGKCCQINATVFVHGAHIFTWDWVPLDVTGDLQKKQVCYIGMCMFCYVGVWCSNATMPVCFSNKHGAGGSEVVQGPQLFAVHTSSDALCW